MSLYLTFTTFIKGMQIFSFIFCLSFTRKKLVNFSIHTTYGTSKWRININLSTSYDFCCNCLTYLLFEGLLQLKCLCFNLLSLIIYIL